MIFDTIVVGIGAAGAAAAATLARAGKRVLALEAMDRVGGRVCTVPFGDGSVELGAEWIHGTVKSRVHELAVEKKIPLLPQDLTYKLFLSDGSEEDAAIINDLVVFCLKMSDEAPEKPEPLGDFLSRKVREHMNHHYPQKLADTAFTTELLHLLDLVMDNYMASDNWNDNSTTSTYEQLEGHQHMSWHRHGYRTIFDILFNTHNKGPGLPNLTVKLNSEVTRIWWDPERCSDVTVTCADGHSYRASNVVYTASLGVLKERHRSLFSTPLPEDKKAAIETVSMGVMDKIELLFDQSWWPEDTCFITMLWKTEDREKIAERDWWLTKILGVSCPMGNRKVLTVWTSGNGAKLAETLPEDVVKRKVMELIRLFLGKKYQIPDPIGILRSTWYTNPYTRGSYTYDNLSTPDNLNARSTLARPLVDAAGKPRVLFAGEATHDVNYSTVHGALDTGYREAKRLLRVASKI